MLYVICVCSVFSPTQWKRIGLAVTAFTLGHSASLILSVLNFIAIPSGPIEVLIPITILVTALVNLWKKDHGFTWWLPALFGLIHGLGFSNYLKSLLSVEKDIAQALFAFNVGIEIGQILIVSLYLLLLALVVKASSIHQNRIRTLLNSIVIVLSFFFIFKAL